MPLCGRYTRHQLTPRGKDSFRLELAWTGGVNLKRLFDDVGLARSVTVREFRSSIDSPWATTIVELDAVRDVPSLVSFCEYLKSSIIVQLTPKIDHCFALGLYSSFEGYSRSRSEVGSLLHRAKYQRDQQSSDDLLNRLLEFISSNPILLKCNAIAVPPKSDSSLPALPQNWARTVAKEMEWELAVCRKTRDTAPQKELGDSQTEDEVAGRVSNSMESDPLSLNSCVLVLDDTIGSGGTFNELSRVVRGVGAVKVFGLAAAKDAKFAKGGIDFS